jgi:disulfide bond formation protein DsbB
MEQVCKFVTELDKQLVSLTTKACSTWTTLKSYFVMMVGAWMGIALSPHHLLLHLLPSVCFGALATDTYL